MGNFLNKTQDQDEPTGSPSPRNGTRGPAGDPTHPGMNARQKYGQLPPAEVDDDAPAGTPVTASTSDRVAELMRSGSLLGNPQYQQILANQTKLTAMRAMPTYVNKRGETVQGMEDQDGRLQSGLKGLVDRLSRMGPTPDWASLGAGVAGAASAGVTGALMPEWNEWSERAREIKRLEDETNQMIDQVEWQSKMMTAEVNRQNSTARVKNQSDQLAERRARNQIQNLRDEHAMFLKPIFERGYFYEDDATPEQRARMQELGIVLADFDNRHKPIVENGVRKAYNPRTRKYEPMEGTEVDPDEVPMTFEVDGKPITASAKWFLNYSAAKERQATQQNFQKSQQEDQQAHSEKIANANKQMTAAQLLDKLTRYADDNGVSLERAKQAFRDTGVKVDEILKRQ